LIKTQEREGQDRNIIDFPGVQNDLIQQVASCSKGPVTLVVMTGGPLDLSIPKGLSKINSILWVGYPGQSGGDAIAKAIFGDYSPAGRLPYTIYPANYINQVSMFDMGMRPNATANTPGRTYRFYTGTPIYPFGHGLFYTTFDFSFTDPSTLYIPSSDLIPHIQENIYSPLTSKPMADITITVKNTGNRKSDVIVQAFVVPANPGKNGNPLKYLVGFSREHDIQPGQSVTVTFPITAHDLSLVNKDGMREVIPGEWKILVDNVHKNIIIN